MKAVCKIPSKKRWKPRFIRVQRFFKVSYKPLILAWRYIRQATTSLLARLIYALRSEKPHSLSERIIRNVDSL